MKYFKTIENGFIVALTTEHGANEISEAEYSNILDIIRHYPKNAPQGKMYLLRADTLEWELAELPAEPEPSEDVDDSEALDIILGVSE